MPLADADRICCPKCQAQGLDYEALGLTVRTRDDLADLTGHDLRGHKEGYDYGRADNH